LLLVPRVQLSDWIVGLGGFIVAEDKHRRPSPPHSVGPCAVIAAAGTIPPPLADPATVMQSFEGLGGAAR
jgi:hypothetical protein